MEEQTVSDSITIISLLVVAWLYCLPLFIALMRGTDNKATVAILNIFLGWTFIGWVICLAMAFKNNHHSR